MSPSKEFIQNFNLCMGYYEVTTDEAKFEKARILVNFAEAEKCYAIIAAGIRRLQTCT